MTRVKRTSEPKVLRLKGKQWLSDLRNALSILTQLEADTTASKTSIEEAKKKVVNIQKRYSHSEIRDALKKMFHGKCAYCESRFGDVTHGHIEHFYPKNPKGGYADKTFEWSNLLLACPVCNDPQHKGTKFPLDANGNPILIDPSDGITDPASHLDFRLDTLDNRFNANIYELDERGRQIKDIFDLNRDDLLLERSEYVEKLLSILEFARTGNSKSKALLKKACQPDAPYRAFALTYIYPYIQNQENQLYDNK